MEDDWTGSGMKGREKRVVKEDEIFWSNVKKWVDLHKAKARFGGVLLEVAMIEP